MITRRLWVALVVLSAVIGLFGCSQSGSGPQAATPSLSAPSEQGLTEVVSAEGVVVPYREANLSFKVLGRIQKILVAEGEAVKAGQELAKVETRDLELAVRRAEAGLKSAQSQLAKAEAGARTEEIALNEAAVAIAQGNLAGAKAALSSAQASLNKLLAGPTTLQIQIAEKQVETAKNQLWGAQGQRDVINANLKSFPPKANAVDYEAAKAQVAMAESEVDIAQLQLEQLKAGAGPEDIATAKAQVAQAQAGVQTAEAQLKQAQAQLDLVKAGSRAEDIAAAEAAVAQAEAGSAEAQNAMEDTVLKAPFESTVGAILIQEGELASPQIPVIRLGDLTRLRVQTEDLSEADVNRVQIGQEATVTVDALEGKTFKGRVARIAPIATESRGDRVYMVAVDLDVGPESGLRWGMSAFVEIKMR